MSDLEAQASADVVMNVLRHRVVAWARRLVAESRAGTLREAHKRVLGLLTRCPGPDDRRLPTIEDSLAVLDAIAAEAELGAQDR